MEASSGSKGVVKSKSPHQKRSSKVKALFGFTQNRYPDVLYYRPTSVRFVQRLDEEGVEACNPIGAL